MVWSFSVVVLSRMVHLLLQRLGSAASSEISLKINMIEGQTQQQSGCATLLLYII